MEQYAALGNITNKTGIATALSFQGGKDVYELFRHTLIEETFGKTNSFQEVFRLKLLAESMGFLSRSQKEAFEFIVQGSSPAFWTNASSYYQDEKGGPDGYLAQACIAAVGLNGVNHR
ncbi:MAG TPA: hypothetical protein P5186_00900 [Candidatus Paceibacterota bacterium]|nr:hypothetical protein [Verrucomicrobiota bacterium]HRY46577.1 hypothetical protein [Candidatus Paceibacterota bacterium]